MRFLVLACAVALLLARLGGTDLWAPDEPRYAAVAEELRELRAGPTGLVVPHLNGEPYTQKPPLYFWLAALAGASGGRVSETAARLPSALAGIAVVWLTIALGSELFSRRSGVLGGAILLTAWEFAHLARRAQLDVLLTLWTTIALAAFWRLERGGVSRRPWLAGMHAALGLAVLTKGPVGVLVPLAVIVATLAWEGRLRQLGPLMPPWALALSLGPGLVWIAAATALAPAGYFDAAVVDNLIGRFFAGSSHARPFYYYAYQFPVIFLPWTPLWALVAWAAVSRVFATSADPERRRAWRFALAWVAATVLFFSLSSGKRALYLLPAFPAVALLCADALNYALAGRDRLPRGVGAALGALAAAIGVAGLLAPTLGETRGVTIPTGLGWATVGVAGAAGLGWLLAKRAGSTVWVRTAIVVATVAAVELLCFTGYFPSLDPEKSPRPIAEAAAALTAPDEPVGLYSKRSLVGGLTYYGHRKVTTLLTPESVDRFVADGGRVLVIPEKYLDQVRESVPVEVRARVRSGRRAVVIVTAAGASDE